MEKKTCFFKQKHGLFEFQTNSFSCGTDFDKGKSNT